MKLIFTLTAVCFVADFLRINIGADEILVPESEISLKHEIVSFSGTTIRSELTTTEIPLKYEDDSLFNSTELTALTADELPLKNEDESDNSELMRVRKASVPSICVEIEPTNPYEPPYYMCRGRNQQIPAAYYQSPYPEYPPAPTIDYTPKAPAKPNFHPFLPGKYSIKLKTDYKSSTYESSSQKPTYNLPQVEKNQGSYDSSKPNLYQQNFSDDVYSDVPPTSAYTYQKPPTYGSPTYGNLYSRPAYTNPNSPGVKYEETKPTFRPYGKSQFATESKNPKTSSAGPVTGKYDKYPSSYADNGPYIKPELPDYNKFTPYGVPQKSNGLYGPLPSSKYDNIKYNKKISPESKYGDKSIPIKYESNKSPQFYGQDGSSSGYRITGYENDKNGFEDVVSSPLANTPNYPSSLSYPSLPIPAYQLSTSTYNYPYPIPAVPCAPSLSYGCQPSVVPVPCYSSPIYSAPQPIQPVQITQPVLYYPELIGAPQLSQPDSSSASQSTEAKEKQQQMTKQDSRESDLKYYSDPGLRSQDGINMQFHTTQDGIGRTDLNQLSNTALNFQPVEPNYMQQPNIGITSDNTDLRIQDEKESRQDKMDTMLYGQEENLNPRQPSDIDRSVGSVEVNKQMGNAQTTVNDRNHKELTRQNDERMTMNMEGTSKDQMGMTDQTERNQAEEENAQKKTKLMVKQNGNDKM